MGPREEEAFREALEKLTPLQRDAVIASAVLAVERRPTAIHWAAVRRLRELCEQLGLMGSLKQMDAMLKDAWGDDLARSITRRSTLAEIWLDAEREARETP